MRFFFIKWIPFHSTKIQWQEKNFQAIKIRQSKTSKQIRLDSWTKKLFIFNFFSKISLNHPVQINQNSSQFWMIKIQNYFHFVPIINTTREIILIIIIIIWSSFQKKNFISIVYLFSKFPRSRTSFIFPKKKKKKNLFNGYKSQWMMQKKDKFKNFRFNFQNSKISQMQSWSVLFVDNIAVGYIHS